MDFWGVLLLGVILGHFLGLGLMDLYFGGLLVRLLVTRPPSLSGVYLIFWLG